MLLYYIEDYCTVPLITLNVEKGAVAVGLLTLYIIMKNIPPGLYMNTVL